MNSRSAVGASASARGLPRHDARAAYGQAVEGEHAGGLPQQAGPVGRGDDDLRPGHAYGAAAVAGERELRGRRLGRDRRRRAGEHGRDAAGELGDQAGLPGAPRGRAGGLAVGDGQRREGLQDDGVADGLGDRLDRHRVVEVAARRGLGQQQVVAYDGLQDPHVAGVEAEPLADVARHHRAGPGVVAGPALADVVQERADQQEVGA